MSSSFVYSALTLIFLAACIGRLGMVRRSTPSFSVASMRSPSILFGKDETALIGAVAELDVGRCIALRRIRRHASRDRQDTLVERDIEARRIAPGTSRSMTTVSPFSRMSAGGVKIGAVLVSSVAADGPLV